MHHSQFTRHDPAAGTVLGVFIPCLQNILGAIYFVRLSWIVAVQGVRNSLIVVGMCCTTTFLTSLSLSAIATNGAIKGGGPYYLISRALGPEFGGSVGLCFFLGTTVAGAMYVLAVVEALLDSFPEAFKICSLDSDPDEPPKMNYRIYGWIILTANTLAVFAGVKYISRVTPFFLIFVLLSVLCILIGILASSATKDYEITIGGQCGDDVGSGGDDTFNLPGITGFQGSTLSDNWWIAAPALSSLSRSPYFASSRPHLLPTSLPFPRLPTGRPGQGRGLSRRRPRCGGCRSGLR